MRLIDADALDKALAEEAVFKIKQADRDAARAEARGLIKAREYVKYAPTVDAVTVVHCRECACWELRCDMATGNLLKEGRCNFWHGRRGPDDFCGHGERKDGEK